MAGLPEPGPYEASIEDEPFSKWEPAPKEFDPWLYMEEQRLLTEATPRELGKGQSSHRPRKAEVAPS